jgi:hypothetical protein
MSSAGQRHERRDTSPAGKWNREQFDVSLILLRTLELSDRVIEYCTQKAHEAEQLPHEVLAQMMEEVVRIEDAVLRSGTRPSERGV